MQLTNRCTAADIRWFDMEKIQHALKSRRSLKATKRKWGTGKNQLYALRDKEGNITMNINKVIKVAEELRRILQSEESLGGYTNR